MKKEIMKAIKGGRLAEYVAANAYQMERDTLKDVIVQLIFTLYDNGLNESAIDFIELWERLGLADEE